MSKAAIRVSKVSKRFRRGEHCDSLRDIIASKLLGHSRRSNQDTDFWALRDISFEVQPGECFGVIGHNGAGKSTLLKLVAGIMRPEEGRISVQGRLSALIEVGAGFHPDLSGGENIYLNASVMGMSRAETRDRFDEIVEFAGIRDFLDTPVKRYSSGMHARLGFSVAAHAEPQVLLVDEVLSVGDQSFRSRCMDRIRAFLKQGVAIVFVSHDLGTITNVCDRVLLLAQGRESHLGQASETVARYHDANAASMMVAAPGETPIVGINEPVLSDESGRAANVVACGDRVTFAFEASFRNEMASPSYGLYLIRKADHLVLYETSSDRLGIKSPPASSGTRQRVRFVFRMNVPPGEYAIGFHVRDRSARRYALVETYALGVTVQGESVSSGPAHLEPTLEIIPAEELSHATPALVQSS